MMFKRDSVPTSLEIPNHPDWQTRAKRPLGEGLWPGTDNSLWLWRKVPMGSTKDARSPVEAEQVGLPLYQAYEELAQMAARGSHRRNVKASYRETHALLLNIPALFEPNPKSPIRDFLLAEQGNRAVLRRVLLFGVKLRPTVGNGSFKSAIASMAETWQYGGAPLSDFEKDIERVSGSLSRAGFSIPSTGDLHLADSWWNRGDAAGVPVLPHEEHIHFFRNIQAARRVTAIDSDDCSNWPVQDSEHAITFATIEDVDLRYTDAKDDFARWVLPLLDQGARAISIRAKVEPAAVTRTEFRGQKSRYIADLRKLAEENKMDRAELTERLGELDAVENSYATGGPPTLHELSAIVAFSGVVEDVAKVTPNGLLMSAMTSIQPAAWHEMMACSSVRANPLLQELPATTVAYSGLPSVSRVGDEDGALLGFGERDAQSTYISPNAATNEDSYPLMGVYGASGSGKTTVALWLAEQFHRMGRPQLFINPKSDTSMRRFVEALGQTYVSLDSFVTSDGALDPVRTIENREDAVATAASMIANVNPYGSMASDLMTEISFGIDYGVKAGAKATGEALMVAREAGVIDRSVTDPAFRFAEVYPMFRATFGMNPSTAPMSLGDGLTLVEVGKSSFKLAADTYQGEIGDLKDPVVRCSMNVIRMLIWGGLTALRHRDGVIHFDESWIMEKGAPGDLDAVGRLARAWAVLPILYTQKPKLQVEIGLKDYISRALIGHIKNEEQAKAALSLFNLEDNVSMVQRITADRYLADGGGLNWESLRALPSPDGRGVERGSVWYYLDLRNRAAPVEVPLSSEFLRRAKPIPSEVAKRAT